MPNWMTKILVGAAFGAAVAIGISVLGGGGPGGAVVQAERSADPAEFRVTEADLEVYIEVYRSMQSDRSLKIDDAVVAAGKTLAEFRNLERRVQSQPRLIKRVREALLEQALENAALLAERGVDAVP